MLLPHSLPFYQFSMANIFSAPAYVSTGFFPTSQALIQSSSYAVYFFYSARNFSKKGPHTIQDWVCLAKLILKMQKNELPFLCTISTFVLSEQKPWVKAFQSSHPSSSHARQTVNSPTRHCHGLSSSKSHFHVRMPTMKVWGGGSRQGFSVQPLAVLELAL